MAEQGEAASIVDQDLFLIELERGEHARYAVVERFLLIDPGHGVMGVPWSDLAALFDGRGVLRAVPLPGRRTGPLVVQSGVSTEPGVSTNVEINLVKIGKGG